MSTYKIRISRDSDDAETLVHLDVNGTGTRVTGVSSVAASGTDLSTSVIGVDLAAIVAAVAGSAPASVTAVKVAEEAATPVKVTAPARKSGPKKTVKSAAPKSAAAPRKAAAKKAPAATSERAYRRRPDDLAATIAQIGESAQVLAEHYGVPTHSIQGWLRSWRKDRDSTPVAVGTVES